MRRRCAPSLQHVVAFAVVVGMSWPRAAGATGPQTVPPPTPVPPSGSPSPFPTALETPDPSSEPPELTAVSSALLDLDSGQVLFATDARMRTPIASVTKIMTALLVLEAVDPGDIATVSANAASQTGAVLGLEPGEEIPVRDLLFALMLQSANDAAVVLAEHVGGSIEEFVARMNERVRQLGLRDTVFASPNGLDDSGYSTARDLGVITTEAYRNPTFAKVVTTRFREIPAPKGAPRLIQNRNALLWLYPDAIGVKTGYTSAAGFCLVAAAERESLRLGGVVLGAPAEAFSDAAELLNYGYATFERRTVVQEGQAFDPLEVEGRSIPVTADVSLSLLVRRDAETELTVRPEPGLSVPVAVGERVGSLVVTSAGASLGEVPLVAAESTRMPPPPERPWWERTWDAGVDFLAGLFQAILG